MSRPTKDHYDGLLGPVYRWMVGDFDSACRRNAALYERVGLRPSNGSIAIDLGSGHGVSSIPLAELGYRVLAVDFCRGLLDELDKLRGAHAIETIEADLLDFRRHVPASATAIVCLGDTLPHIPDTASVAHLLGEVARVLEPGGLFVATFRDYVSRQLTGTERFIPVKSDADRILTCVLDYASDSVTVNDLLHVRDGSVWKQYIGSYTKLRLDLNWLTSTAETAGLEVCECCADGGLVTFAARVPG